MTYTPLFSPPGGHQLNLPSNQVIADRKASTVAMPNGLNIGGRNVIQKYMPNLAGAQPAMYSTPPMPQQAYAFPPPPPHAARAFFPSPEPTIDGAHAPTRHLPIGVQDASGAMQAGLGLSFEGGAPISQEELDEAAACHGGRYPDRSQLSPEALGHVVHRILPPIVNTGNQGQMKPQMGDWVCGQCRFTNWRRRRICRKCFPAITGNADHPEGSPVVRRTPSMHPITSFLHSPVAYPGSPIFYGPPPSFVPDCNPHWMMQVTSTIHAQQAFMAGQHSFPIPAHAPIFIPAGMHTPHSLRFTNSATDHSPASSGSVASPVSTVATSVSNSPVDQAKPLPEVVEEEGKDEDEDEGVVIEEQGEARKRAIGLEDAFANLRVISTPERPNSAMGHLAHTVHSPPSPLSSRGSNVSNNSGNSSPPRSRCATAPGWTASAAVPTVVDTPVSPKTSA